MKLSPRIARRNRSEQGSVRSQVRNNRRLALERLEDRHLLAIGVGPNVNISQRALNQASGAIAIDRTQLGPLFSASSMETTPGIFISYSTDSGATWNGQIIGDGAGDPFPLAAGSPSVAWDDFGNLFLTYVSTGTNQAVVLRSVDGGQSFSQLATLGFFVTQPTIVTGPGFNSPGSVWVTWNQFGSIQVTGAPVTGLGSVGAFGGIQTVPNSDVNFTGESAGDMAIGPNGQVMVAYETTPFCFGDQPGDCEGSSAIFTNVDPDGLGPQTFGLANQAATTNVGTFDFIGPQSGRGVSAEPGLAYDRTGGLNDGRVYLVYTDEAGDETDDTDIFVSFSDDEGASWTSPVRVNDDTSGNSQFLPRIALDQTTGDVAVSWYDSRNDDGGGGSGDTDLSANTDAQYFASVSSDGGASFEANAQISVGTSNASAANSRFDLGDYTGLDFHDGIFFPIWADNSTALGNNPSLPQLDVATAQVSFQDSDGPYVIAVDPLANSILDGPVDFVDFTFNESMDTLSFDLLDVATFRVTDTLGITTDLRSELAGFSWLAPNLLRVFFNAQGPAGDYTMTIGPSISDDAGNAMNQDRDTTNGEPAADQFTVDFTISTLVVTKVQVNANSLVINFNKAVEPGTLSGGVSTCGAGDNVFLEGSGGDFAFAFDPGNTVADQCVPTTAILTGPDQITVNFGGVLATDLYRVHLRSGGLTDVSPMDNALDGEFEGPPPGGNNNVFPSGDGVVGGDFLYRFVTGDAPLQDPTSAVLPPVLVTGEPVVVPTFQNSSNPTIAVDPLDPLRMVAVWTINNPSTNPVTVRNQGAFSVNGGQSWTSFFFPGNIFNPATTNPIVPYPEATDASVAFDRNHAAYIVYTEHTADYGQGALVLQKYDMSGNTPSQIVTNQVLYQWIADAAFNPTIVIDTNVASFTDPETGSTQSDPWSGNVYVAWNTQNVGQSNNTNFNPNVIKVIASSDGGNSFSSQIPINDGSGCTFNAFPPPTEVRDVNCGNERDGQPRLVVSQGTADGRVPGGQVTIVWNDFLATFNTNPPRNNTVVVDMVPDGAVGASFSGNGGFVSDAFDPGNNQPHIPSVSTFPITVNITDPRFAAISDLDVTVNLAHAALQEIRLRLIPPAGTGLGPIVLANNRTDSAGNQTNTIGMTGASIGNTASGFFIGGVFDQNAARSIVAGAAPYTGRFHPEGDLDDVNGLTAAEINGAWTLEVTDFRQGSTQNPFPQLRDWTLDFTSGMTTGFDIPVANVCALATANGPYNSRSAPASPNRGIASGVSLAADNTLGSFSPYQGRLYMTLAHAAGTNCSGSETNFDIYMLTSDDAGSSWTVQGIINDDTDSDGTTGGRTQFNPAVAVDPVTGTVVAAWLDARNDAANARVATYVTASNDGGQTWSENVFVNRAHTATNCYLQFSDQNCSLTTQDIIYGPIPDNQSGNNPARDQRFNFGDHIGLAVFDGLVTPVWAGNENETPLNNDCCTTDLFVGHARVTAGPRIADSTMGWVDAPVGSFLVTFDRLIDPNSFTADPGVPGSVIFQADFETANDNITFDGTFGFTFDNSGADGIPGTPDDGLWHRSMGRGGQAGHSATSSMYYGQGETSAGGGNYDTGFENAGRLLSPVIDLTSVPAGANLSLSFNYFLETENLAGFDRANVNVVVSSATLVASNTINLLDPSLGFQFISLDISSFAGQVIQLEFSFDSVDSIFNDFEGWYVDDVAIIDNGIAPDVQVFHRDLLGNDTPVPVTSVIPVSCNPIGCNQFQVNFVPQSDMGTYYYAIGPSISDRIRLSSATIVPGSTLTQAATPPQVPRPINDVSVTTSTITISNAPAGTVITDVNVSLSLLHTFDSDLIITLIHPDGTRVILSNRNGGAGDNFIGTTFDDQAAIPIGFWFPPFTGSFQPDSALGALIGKAVNGTYTLEIADVAFIDTGTLLSWSLAIQTGTVISTARSGNFMDQNANGVPSEYGPLTTPPLFTSSTQNTHDIYLTPLSYGDTSTLPLMVTGPRIDPKPGSTRVGTEYTANDLALPLPIVNGGTVSSTFTILDNFPLYDLDVVLNISGANLADLQVELVREDNLKTIPLDPTTIRLFNAGDLSGSTLSRTVFSDDGAPMGTGTAPYRATFRPRGSLAVLQDTPGMPYSQSDTAGRWTLRVTDVSGSGGTAGTLDSWGIIVNPTLQFTNSLNPLELADNATTSSTINVPVSFPVSDLSVTLNIFHPFANELDIVLRHVPTNTVVTLVQDVAGGGSNFINTTFDDEGPVGINAPGSQAPYSGVFRPQTPLSALDGIDAAGVWRLEITDDTLNGFRGVLNNWTLDFGPAVQAFDLLSLHGTANFMDVVFDRDMDPSTFTTVDVQRIVGPAGQIGATPLGPYRYSTLDTTPNPVPIPDGSQVRSTIRVADSYPIGDVDVLLDINHPNVDQLHLYLIGPNGFRVELIDNLSQTSVPNLVTTILDDEAATGIAGGTPPYSGRFRPTQRLDTFDGLNSAGTWTLEINDEGTGGTGTLTRWDLVLTRDPNRYASALPAPLPIPDNGTTVSNTVHVADSYPIHDLDVVLNITHARVQDLEVTLVGPSGVKVPLVANLPALGANLTNTVLDDEARNIITAGTAPFTGRFRPVLPSSGRTTQLADFEGLDAQGDWVLQVRDLSSGNQTSPQQLNSWSLLITASEYRVLANPNGTDPDANHPRTYRVYFPRQVLSGTYAVSLSSQIASEDGDLLDQNRNAGLAALRRGDGSPNSPETAVDFVSIYTSVDVGDPGTNRPIPEPIGNAVRPITSRIYIPDNVAITDLNIELTITHQQPPGQRPLMRDDDYDVFLISPAGTRLELFSDIGGAGVNFVQLVLDDEAERCLKACQPVYVQDGNSPFSDDFRPEGLKPPFPGFPEGTNGLRVFDGENARGVWTLEIVDDTANGLTAALRDWSITISGRTTGVGEFASDQISTSFRIFVMDPADPRSSSSWTAVGPANDNGRNDDSNRTGAIAVDPSDPSGNTVYVAGATGGVWKTTNFLTTDPAGPTYVPLTDFAPTLGLHIGSIALFPRNNDPNQTVVYVATGEADAGMTGVGFLKSEDGGATWRLQDSLNNSESIPFSRRDHTLAGRTTAFKVVVDPTFPDGRVAYAALSGGAGGLYKTVDGGITWTNSRPGQATDVVLDPINTEVVFAAFRGEGVLISSDRAAQWRLMAGGVNNAQVRDVDVPGISNGVVMPIGAPQGTPNGGKGRISLAKPFLLGNPELDRAYEGRLYAIVSTPNDLFDGAYMTSDFGANWTKLELGRVTLAGANCPAPPVPTNDETNNTDVDPFTLGCLSGQGNYDQAIIVDPLNPDRFYIFGTGYPDSPVLAVDVTQTYDGHHYKIFDHNNSDGGATEYDTVGGAVRKLTRDTGITPPFCEPFACLNGFFDFGGDALGANESRVGLYRGLFNNIGSFANNGNETRWSPMLLPIHVDYHDVATVVDPITGMTRLILGTDGGVYSLLTESGYNATGRAVFSDYYNSTPPSPSIGNSMGPASGSRNGNLQTSQLYGGATQPSQLAAEIAALYKGGGMFYGAFQDNGASTSDPLILQNGNIAWVSYFLPQGDAGNGLTTALADDDSTLGDAYIYLWPCCGGDGSDVIRLNNIPRVTGLDQDIPLLPAAGTFDFAINYRDARELLFSGPTGRLYKTDDAGRQWLEIGNPAVFGGQVATSWAFGAEQPDANPNDFIEPDELIYVGLPNGRVMTSLTEGGDGGQEWFDISAGLFGGRVEDIAANIRQFSQEAFLVTSTAVFWMPEDPQPDSRICRFPGRNDIIPGGDAAVKSRLIRAICDVIQSGPASNVNNPWIDITGNLRSIQHTIFPGAWNGEGTLGPIVDTLPILFSSIKVDDRYQIPDATGQRSPLVYVGAGFPNGGSGAGVFRTFDHGQTWRRYPDPEIDGAPIEGGYLPTANVTEIELSIGPYDPETGLSDFNSSLDLLVAHTYGRGTFAIRSAPLIFTTEGNLISNAPNLLDADDSVPPVPPFPPAPSGSPYNQDNITRNDGSANAPLRFEGLTHRGASVRLLEDSNGVLTEIGRGLADFYTGDWTVYVGDTNSDGIPDGLTLGCGQHVIRAQGISASGTVGQVSDPITITVLNEPPIELVAPDLLAADDTGVSNTDNITRVAVPRFSGATFCGLSGEAVPQAIIRLMVRDPAGSIVDPNDPNPATNRYRTVGLGSSAADGTWIVQVSAANLLPDGTYVFTVRAEDLAGNIGPLAPTVNVTIDTRVTPSPSVTNITTDTCAPLGSLPPTPCSFGSRTDQITADQTLIFGGVSEPGSTVTLRQVGGAILSSTIPTDGSGNWSYDNTAQVLTPGPHSFTVSAIDIAGNTSAVSASFTVNVDISIAKPSAPDLSASSDSGLSNNDNITSDDTPSFTGTAEALSRVEIFDGATSLGFAVVGNDASDGFNNNGLGLWTFTSPQLTCLVALGCSHTIGVVATDLAGNVSIPSDTLTITIDTIAPASPPSTPDMTAASDSQNVCPTSPGTDSDDYTNVTTPTFVGTAEPSSVVTVFDGATTLGTTPVGPNNGTGVGNWTFTVASSLAAGQHNITARTTDLAGNVGPSSGVLTITVDTTVSAPSTPDLAAASDSGSSNTDNITNATTLTFTGSAEGSPGNGCVEVFAGLTSLGVTSVDSAGNWVLNSMVALADGTYVVTAKTTDRAGNVSSSSSALVPSLVIDRTKPNPPTQPDLTAASDTGISSSDNITRDDTPSFTGTATTNTTVRLFAGNTQLGQTTPAANGTWTITSPHLDDGIYQITATATDVAGNISDSSPALTVTIDTVIAAPAAPDLDPSSDTGLSSTDNITRDSTPTFTNPAGSAEGSSTLTLLDGVNTVGTVQVAANGSWSFTLVSPLTDAVHLFTARAVDIAGNTSVLSAPLAVTIDTQIATPTIDSIQDDNGPSSSDHITNDPTLIFRGIAEANSTIQFSQNLVGTLPPCPPGSPNVTADALGNWTFDNTCRSLADGNHSFSVSATDIAGNVSASSALLGVVIDTVAPGVPVGTLPTPTLALGDDTGVQGDGITSLRRPRLAGTVTGVGVGNVLVEILDTANMVLGSSRTAANGSYTVQFNSNLVDGVKSVRVRATDDAGNTAVSGLLSFTVDGTPPNILGFTPTGTLITTTSQFIVQFNNDDLNQTAPGDPAFAGSVRNLNNFRLVGNSHGQFDLSTSQFSYDSTLDQLVVNLRNAAGAPAFLPNDSWQFRIDGTSSLQDIAGNRIDGENPGVRPGQTTRFPTGNDVPGGDFTTTFVIAVPPPRVVDIQLASTKKVVILAIVSFSQPLDRTLAANGTLYELLDQGPDHQFDTGDERAILLGLPRCNPLPAPCTTVTLEAIRGFSQNRFFQLRIDDLLADPGGNRLDGNGDGVPGGDFRGLVGRGRQFSYNDKNGDLVSLSLVGGGLMDVVRYANGEGRTIRMERNVAGQSVIPGKSALVGSVTRQPGGDGLTHFDAVTGTSGVNLSGFQRPPFLVGSISANVVDRLLDSNTSAQDLVADSVLSELLGRRGR